MNATILWRPSSRIKRPEGHGVIVERDGQLGYAKLEGRKHELLASLLAEAVDAPVPHVEWGSIEGAPSDITYVISHIHSPASRPLATKAEVNRASYSPAEIVALRETSGLIPFLAWVSATDHNDDTNLVVDDLDEGRCRVVAIDFEHAFEWPQGNASSIMLYASRGLKSHADPELVDRHLRAIEELDDETIRLCCADAHEPTDIADPLVRRKSLVRDVLAQTGLLPG